MDDWSAELLERKDYKLFAHGGCHIFADILRKAFNYDPVVVKYREGQTYHIGCAPKDAVIVDVRGWRLHSEYIKDEGADQRFRFSIVEWGDIEREYVYGPGPGYYMHRDFVDQAYGRASAWIQLYRKYFDGTCKSRIPNIPMR